MPPPRDQDIVLDANADPAVWLRHAPIAAGELAEPGGLLDRIASRHDAAPGQAALAWLLADSPVMVPIPGTSSVEHLEQNLDAASLRLPDDEVAELESASG